MARVFRGVGERLFHQHRQMGVQHLVGHGAVGVVRRGEDDTVADGNQVRQGIRTRQRVVRRQRRVQHRRQGQAGRAAQRVQMAAAHQPSPGQSDPDHAPPAMATMMPRSSASPRMRPING